MENNPKIKMIAHLLEQEYDEIIIANYSSFGAVNGRVRIFGAPLSSQEFKYHLANFITLEQWTQKSKSLNFVYLTRGKRWRIRVERKKKLFYFNARLISTPN